MLNLRNQRPRRAQTSRRPLGLGTALGLAWCALLSCFPVAPEAQAMQQGSPDCASSARHYFVSGQNGQPVMQPDFGCRLDSSSFGPTDVWTSAHNAIRDSSPGSVEEEVASTANDIPQSLEPALVMKRPAVDRALHTLLKDDFATYAAMMAEPGKGRSIGRDYYGSTCLKGDCDAGYATLFVDNENGAVYVAWTESGNLFFRPDLDLWPEKAEVAYEFWPEN